jgi:hypothetical protein
MIIDEVKAN